MTGPVGGAGPEPVPGPPLALLPDDAWHGWFAMYDRVLVVTVAAVPLAALAVWALVRRRRAAGAPPASARRAALAEVGIALAMLPALWLTMAPGARAGSGAVSLVPLQDLRHMGTVQVLGNLLLLAVPGLLAPLRFAAVASFPRMLVAAAVVSASIETAQLVLQLDRVSSVDDVLLNTVGAGLAALASRRWWRHAHDRGVTRSRRALVV